MDDDLFDFSDELENKFKEAKVETTPANKEVPDGKYQVQVMKAVVEKKNDKRCLNWHLRILNGENAGRYLFTNNQLDNEVGVAVLKRNLTVLGIEMNSLKDLKDTLPKLLDKRIEVQKKQNVKNPKFYNVFFNELLEVDDEDPF